jgi:hypothetical protein
MISLFFHNYYGDHEGWVRFFAQKIKTPFALFYNIVEDSVYNLPEDRPGLPGLHDRLLGAASGSALQYMVLRRSPNRGKDIGGKLVLLDAYLRRGAESDYLVFLHDKKSPYKLQNVRWQQNLFRIIEPPFIEKTLRFFAEQPKSGIVAGAQSIMNEYDFSSQAFASNNRSLLTRLQSEYSIFPAQYNYVAGTMFWARSLPLLTFLGQYPPLDIRQTLESGNVLDEQQGTMTHSWERLLSWLIIAQGYSIKGFQ